MLEFAAFGIAVISLLASILNFNYPDPADPADKVKRRLWGKRLLVLAVLFTLIGVLGYLFNILNFSGFGSKIIGFAANQGRPNQIQSNLACVPFEQGLSYDSTPPTNALGQCVLT